MGLQIFAPAYAFVDGKLDTFLHDRAADVIAQVAGPMRLALVLYVLLYGVAILRGAISEPVIDFAVRSVKLTIIYLLATTVAYSAWVTTPLFHTLPDTLTQAISGAATPDVGAAFDQFFNRAAYLGAKIGKQATLADWTPIVLAGAVYVTGALAAAIGFGIVLLAKLALALLVALGPLFVACALFEGSRRFFFGWLAQAVNYVILMALIVTVFQLILSLVAAQWSAIDGQDALEGGLTFLAMSILGAIFFLQIPAIAAGIAGGASAGLADFGNAAVAGLRLPSPRPSPGAAGGATQAPRTSGSLRPLNAKV